MKEVMRTIDQAHGLLSQMLVNGENVDLLAGARQALRVAYGQLEVMVKEAEKKAEEATEKEAEEKTEENDEKAEEVTEDGDEDREPAENTE